MEKECMRKWMEEIRFQCRMTAHAWQQMRHSLVGMDSDTSFFYIHAFLNHSMEIGQMLWPEGADHQLRGTALREALQLGEEHLLNHPILRQIVTQFDQRMELWMRSLDTPHFLNLNIMPKGTMDGAREDLFVRSLDPETYRLELLDHQFDLRPFNDALRKLDQTIERWLQKHSY